MGRRIGIRRGVCAIIGTALIVAIAPRDAASTEGGNGVITLRERQEAFWEGSLEQTVPTSLACAAVDGACASYAIDVTESAWRLRVALDRPSSTGELSVALLDPSGNDHATAVDVRRDATQSAIGLYSFELYGERPVVGRWTLRVTARSGPLGPFRMRAKLEAEPKDRSRPRDLLPNLRPIPPFELTFTDPTPGSLDGCRLEEQREYAPAGPCLRFSTGPTNVGTGPLDLRYAGGVLEGDIQQRIHRTDGSSYEVPGGRFHYHVDHFHYHHDSIGAMILQRVEPDGTLAPVGDAPKTGYCMWDYLIAEWDRFAQSAARAVEDQVTGCGSTLGPTGANLGLTAGWGDVYGWMTIGNFVDFAGQGDGEYVLTMTSDADSTIVESDETDNTAYTWLRVTGRTVEVLERGIGTGPSDPAKVVVTDTRPPALP